MDDEAERETVDRIAMLHGQGFSLREIAQRLEGEGRRTSVAAHGGTRIKFAGLCGV